MFKKVNGVKYLRMDEVLIRHNTNFPKDKVKDTSLDRTVNNHS